MKIKRPPIPYAEKLMRKKLKQIGVKRANAKGHSGSKKRGK